jgi:hypothetical protein
MKHEVQLIWNNVEVAAGYGKGLDFGGLLLVVWGVALVWAADSRRPLVRRQVVWWAVLSAGVYLAGYVVTSLTAGGDRFLWPLMPLGLGLWGLMIDGLTAGPRRMATALLVLSFAAGYVYDAYGLWGLYPGQNTYELAAQARSLHPPAPLAATDWAWGLILAYHLDEPYLGRPRSTQPEEMAAELARAGAGSFVVFDNPKLSAELDRAPNLVRITPQPLRARGGVEINIFRVKRPPG